MSSRKAKKSPPSVDNYVYPLGQQVNHSKFGEGTVLDYDGTGEKIRIHINFKDLGNKWLYLSHANLNII